MKELMLLIPLGSALLLTGCAGTETEFQCNATTSDTCMTMEQANEKAKLKEERSDAKPAAAGLPRLADGNFRTTSPKEGANKQVISSQADSLIKISR
ncbi:type IV conjugative transfer system lipoprotein TraV, partial [Klebsiella pneumoniae]